MELQWRGIAIVIIIIIDVIFFAVVFVVMDNNQIKAANVTLVNTEQPVAGEKVDPSVDWLLCLVAQRGDKTNCLDKSANLIMNQATITAVLVLLSVGFLLLLVVVKDSANNLSATAFGYCFSCRASRCSPAGTTWSSQKPSRVGSL